MNHPGFLTNVDKIIAWLGFNDKNFFYNKDHYVVDNETFKVSLPGSIVSLNPNAPFIRVQFEKVMDFEASDSSLLSLVGMPTEVINRLMLVNLKNLKSLIGLPRKCGEVVLSNILNPKLLSYQTAESVKCTRLELFERQKISLVGISTVFLPTFRANLEFYDCESGGLELLNMRHNAELDISVDVLVRTPTRPLDIIKKYLSLHNSPDYLMDCCVELIDSGYEQYTQM